jgi:hypothetical protein
MPAHKPLPIEEFVQQIQEALEQIRQIPEALEQIRQIQVALDDKPDRDELEYWSGELAFKMEELKDEVAETKDKVDDLQIEDR